MGYHPASGLWWCENPHNQGVRSRSNPFPLSRLSRLLPLAGRHRRVDENSSTNSWVRLTLTCARTCTIARSCTCSVACSPSPSPSRPAPALPSRLYLRSSHAGPFWSTKKSFHRRTTKLPMCYDRCGYARCSYNECGYDSWCLRGTSPQAPCPGLGPAEERARAHPRPLPYWYCVDTFGREFVWGPGLGQTVPPWFQPHRSNIELVHTHTLRHMC